MALSQVILQRYKTWYSYLNKGELNKTELSLEESEATILGHKVGHHSKLVLENRYNQISKSLKFCDLTCF